MLSTVRNQNIEHLFPIFAAYTLSVKSVSMMLKKCAFLWTGIVQTAKAYSNSTLTILVKFANVSSYTTFILDHKPDDRMLFKNSNTAPSFGCPP